MRRSQDGLVGHWRFPRFQLRAQQNHAWAPLSPKSCRRRLTLATPQLKPRPLVSYQAPRSAWQTCSPRRWATPFQLWTSPSAFRTVRRLAPSAPSPWLTASSPTTASLEHLPRPEHRLRTNRLDFNALTVLPTLSKCISRRRNVAMEQAVFRRLHARIAVEIRRRTSRQIRSCWPAVKLSSDILYLASLSRTPPLIASLSGVSAGTASPTCPPACSFAALLLAGPRGATSLFTLVLAPVTFKVVTSFTWPICSRANCAIGFCLPAPCSLPHGRPVSGSQIV